MPATDLCGGSYDPVSTMVTVSVFGVPSKALVGEPSVKTTVFLRATTPSRKVCSGALALVAPAGIGIEVAVKLYGAADAVPPVRLIGTVTIWLIGLGIFTMRFSVLPSVTFARAA